MRIVLVGLDLLCQVQRATHFLFWNVGCYVSVPQVCFVFTDGTSLITTSWLAHQLFPTGLRLSASQVASVKFLPHRNREGKRY
jgi:hypothetical protein